MTNDKTEGQWEQLKGRVRKAWGELTDDDVEKAKGSKEKLVGIIQEKYGETKEAIKKKIDNM